ncbi:HD domain-containing protein [Dactylosporangium sp. NPDC005555]|uniref:HD domain-containing protein n=1 Tax=Dactylosporangium sp. NPDC005555 TaxID=3154889 RepID=UPI0033A47491
MTDLERALAEPGLRPLPAEAAAVLRRVDAPPRLAAHLRLVHDVAAQLLDWLAVAAPHLSLDREAVLFGAATHDIGKTLHPEELRGPGSAHEVAGTEMLREHGDLARFAVTHARWERPDATPEELLVTLADKVWKGKRVEGLERRVADLLGGEPWEAFMTLDDELTRIAGDADTRLAFQATYPI